MKYEDKLYGGLSIEIIVHDGEYEGKYRTILEELGVKILSIGVPITEGQFIPLREGTSLEVAFCDDVSAYSFSSVIIQRISFPVPTFVIEYPNKINKIQRRHYLRLDIAEPLEYCILGKNGLGKVNKGSLIDLSGGGVLFKAKNSIPEKTIIIVKTEIRDANIELAAAVIRSIKEEEGDLYKIAAEFYGITENTRDRIIRYILDVQREMRKKGLI